MLYNVGTNETYEPGPEPRLDCPVTALGGLADEDVSRQDLEGWTEVSSGRFKLRMFSGDHFYLHDRRHELIRAVAEELLPLLL